MRVNTRKIRVTDPASITRLAIKLEFNLPVIIILQRQSQMFGISQRNSLLSILKICDVIFRHKAVEMRYIYFVEDN